AQAAAAASPPTLPSSSRWRPGARSFAALLSVCVAGVVGAAMLWPKGAMHQLTQKDIDAAVLRTMQTATLPSQAARAAEVIRPSVVRVVGYGPEKPTADAKALRRGRNLARGAQPEDDAPPGEVERGVGTGVVIVDKGVILTNLHVVSGAEKIKVTFADGLESNATVASVQPENDLAVLQAEKIPDDLIAATMRSTTDLQSGDQVVAVGFPFGIGFAVPIENAAAAAGMPPF
ncbi:MAG: peptidase S1, partial [Comamonadaceae bacterium]